MADIYQEIMGNECVSKAKQMYKNKYVRVFFKTEFLSCGGLLPTKLR